MGRLEGVEIARIEYEKVWKNIKIYLPLVCEVLGDGAEASPWAIFMHIKTNTN